MEALEVGLLPTGPGDDGLRLCPGPGRPRVRLRPGGRALLPATVLPEYGPAAPGNLLVRDRPRIDGGGISAPHGLYLAAGLVPARSGRTRDNKRRGSMTAALRSSRRFKLRELSVFRRLARVESDGTIEERRPSYPIVLIAKAGKTGRATVTFQDRGQGNPTDRIALTFFIAHRLRRLDLAGLRLAVGGVS